MGPDLPTVVFDGDCAFCTSSARLLASWSAGRLRVIPWQRADLASLGLTEAQCAAALQYVDGRVVRSGGAGVAAALSACDQPWRTLGRLLARPWVAPLADGTYRLVAANRHRLPGGTPACRLPAGQGSS